LGAKDGALGYGAAGVIRKAGEIQNASRGMIVVSPFLSRTAEFDLVVTALRAKEAQGGTNPPLCVTIRHMIGVAFPC
jgi:hypothetical protein